MSNIQAFIKLIEEEEFIEAHEVLEHDWLDFKKSGQLEIAKLHKGLINGATSIALHKLNRSKRAKEITWNAFLKYQIYLDFIEGEEKNSFVEAISLIEEKYKEIASKV